MTVSKKKVWVKLAPQSCVTSRPTSGADMARLGLPQLNTDASWSQEMIRTMRARFCIK